MTTELTNAAQQALEEAHMLILPIPAPEVSALELAKVVSERATKIATLLTAALSQRPAAQPTPEPVVPDGFALVPVEPTIGMLIAGMEHRISEEQPTHEHAVWSAMIAASQQKGGQ